VQVPIPAESQVQDEMKEVAQKRSGNTRKNKRKLQMVSLVFRFAGNKLALYGTLICHLCHTQIVIFTGMSQYHKPYCFALAECMSAARHEQY